MRFLWRPWVVKKQIHIWRMTCLQESVGCLCIACAPAAALLAVLLLPRSSPAWGGHCFIPEYLDCRDPFFKLVNQCHAQLMFLAVSLLSFSWLPDTDFESLFFGWLFYCFWFCFFLTYSWIICGYFIVHLCYFFLDFQISDLQGSTDPLIQATSH